MEDYQSELLVKQGHLPIKHSGLSMNDGDDLKGGPVLPTDPLSPKYTNDEHVLVFYNVKVVYLFQVGEVLENPD